MGEDREWISFNKLMEVTFLDKFYDSPAATRDKITMRGAMFPLNKEIKPSDVVLTIVHAEGRERTRVSADGTFDLRPSEKLTKANPMVYINMPKGEKASLQFGLYAVLPPGQSMSYVSLLGGVKQANDLVKAKAGLLRVFAPKFNGVELHFAQSAQQQLQIISKGGVRTLTADAKGALALRLDEAVFSDNPQIILSERPFEVEITAE
ncbi:MAG: DUF2987 domain-containing protein [Betaproteobacteria bacterium]